METGGLPDREIHLIIGGKKMMKSKNNRNKIIKNILVPIRNCGFFSLVLLFVLFQVGCQSVPRIFGGVDLMLLEGEWHGEYYSKDTGRSGALEFRLKAGKDKAYGVVVMIPRGSEKPYHPSGALENPDVSPLHPELLSISFVNVIGGKIRGELTPYWDPDMQRTLFMTFEGNLKGDTLEGIFESRIEQSPIYFFGQWKVFRKK